jgi:hypothetical protein
VNQPKKLTRTLIEWKIIELIAPMLIFTGHVDKVSVIEGKVVFKHYIPNKFVWC